MSPTSSDGRAASPTRFTRALVALVTVLALACGVLAILGFVQGPKLASAQIDVVAATTQSGQQLRLFVNQAIAEVSESQVTITPAAPISVSTSGDLVAVQFDGMLQYDTAYTVRVEGVTGVSPSGTGTLEYRFDTASPELYYVVSGDPADQVMRSTLGEDDATSVYFAPGIREVALVGQALAVVRDLDDGTSTLELVSLTEGIAETVALPFEGTISQFDASTAGASVGFVLTGLDGEGRTLYTADLETTRDFTPVADLSGAPLQVSDWEFVPASTQFVALSAARSLLLADAASDGALAPLGQLTELGRVSRDGQTVTGRDTIGPVAVTIADGSRRALEFRAVGDAQGFVGETEVLPDGTVLARVALDMGDGTFRVVVVIDDGSTARVVYDGGGADIMSVEVSPNVQLAAVDLESTQTVIVDLATGLVKQTLPGTGLRW